MDKYKIFLFSVFILTWIWAAINPVHPETWLYENVLIFIFFPVVIFAGRYFKLSNVSYTLITIFMVIHLIGAHYTYSEVPFGFVLRDWFDESRNMYDRLVHFSFGFLLAYPVREVVLRLAKTKGVWGFTFPLSVVVMFSALFEIAEWYAVQTTQSVEVSLEFLGMQGDIWDAQKDMVLAFWGACIALAIVAFINWKYDRHFGCEVKESLKIKKGDKPLGEVQMRRWLKEKARRIKRMSTKRR